MSKTPTPELTDDQKEKMVAEALKGLREVNWHVMKDLIAFQAKKYRLRYDALVKEGFAETQAMYIMMQDWS